MAAGSDSSTALSVSGLGLTDVGQKRQQNEDSIIVMPEHHVYGVADGMGGHNAGDVASSMAVAAMEEFFASGSSSLMLTQEEQALPPAAQKLVGAVYQANHNVTELSHASVQHKGMGSTVVVAHVVPERSEIHICHVGDSRCYRVREGQLVQLTRDHSVINEALALKPDLSEEILRQLPTNVVTRALGMSNELKIDTQTVAILPDDLFIMCSDGLTGMVSDEQILDSAKAVDDLHLLCSELIFWANEAGGKDNISVVLVRIERASQTAESAVRSESIAQEGEQETATDDADLTEAEIELSPEELLELDFDEEDETQPELARPMGSDDLAAPDEAPSGQEEPSQGSGASEVVIGSEQIEIADLEVVEGELELELEEEEPQSAEDRCRHCGHWLFAGHLYCVECGASADVDDEPIPQPQPIEKLVKMSVHRIVSLDKERHYTVRSVSVVTDQASVVATKAIDIVRGESDLQHEEMLIWQDTDGDAIDQPSEDRCSYCGTWLLAGNAYCTECGGPTEPYDDDY